MGISNLTRKCLKSVEQAAISDCLLKCYCSVDFDHFDIKVSDPNKFRLLIEESLFIKHDQPQLNKAIKPFLLKLFDSDIKFTKSDYNKFTSIERKSKKGLVNKSYIF